MKITKYVQSTFLIESEKIRLLIDPGKYNLDHGITHDVIGKIDVMIITHKHGDHFNLELTKSICDQYSPKILTNEEISQELTANGIDATIGEINTDYLLEGFNITVIPADHAVRGNTIDTFGIVIERNGKRVYHTSDTRFMDLTTLNEDKVKDTDALLVPISNRGVVMGIDDALYFTNELSPKVVIPMHYDSPKDERRVNPADFVSRAGMLKTELTNLANIQINVLDIGNSLTLNS